MFKLVKKFRIIFIHHAKNWYYYFTYIPFWPFSKSVYNSTQSSKIVGHLKKKLKLNPQNTHYWRLTYSLWLVKWGDINCYKLRGNIKWSKIGGINERNLKARSAEDVDFRSGPWDFLIEIFKPLVRLILRQKARVINDLTPIPEIQRFLCISFRAVGCLGCGGRHWVEWSKSTKSKIKKVVIIYT